MPATALPADQHATARPKRHRDAPDRAAREGRGGGGGWVGVPLGWDVGGGECVFSVIIFFWGGGRVWGGEGGGFPCFGGVGGGGGFPLFFFSGGGGLPHASNANRPGIARDQHWLRLKLCGKPHASAKPVADRYAPHVRGVADELPPRTLERGRAAHRMPPAPPVGQAPQDLQPYLRPLTPVYAR